MGRARTLITALGVPTAGLGTYYGIKHAPQIYERFRPFNSNDYMQDMDRRTAQAFNWKNQKGAFPRAMAYGAGGIGLGLLMLHLMNRYRNR